MIEDILKTIKANDMFAKGDKVIVAVSGGPDSISLLHLLHSLKEKLHISLAVAHVNHSLRGDESDKDEAYVKEFCARFSIDYFVRKADIHKIEEEKGISCETAGREVRYEFFSELLKEIKADKIALAHNANDQAETVLMRIMRGTGMEGLIGIKPVRDKIFVRPLINVKREEIEKYCLENNLEPRIDKSNMEKIYNRNKIRLELIPYIKVNFNEDIISTINRLSSTINKDNQYLEEIANKKFEKFCKKDHDKVIIYEKAFKEPEAIITRIIRIALRKVVGNLYNFEKSHIYDVISIQANSTSKMVTLPNHVVAINDYKDVQLFIKENYKNIVAKSEYVLKTNNIIKNGDCTSNENCILNDDCTSNDDCTLNYEEKTINIRNEGYNSNIQEKFINIEIKDYNLKIEGKLINGLENVVFKNKKLTECFDYDKICGDITIRRRREGDRFTPLGMSGSKKLKDFFIDLKISKDKRDNIPLICFGDDIAWVVGWRINEKYKINQQSKNILEIRVESEELK